MIKLFRVYTLSNIKVAEFQSELAALKYINDNKQQKLIIK